MQQHEIGILKEGNRQAQSALRRRARTTRTSVLSPFESIMKDIGESGLRPLVQEVCRTCGDHDSNECTWMMFPGSDLFARIPFHAAHKILEEGFSQFAVNLYFPCGEAFRFRKSFCISLMFRS